MNGYAVVEMRCPENPRRLFGTLQVSSNGEREVWPERLLEFACRDCRRAKGAVQVFHRYNLLAQHVETEEVPFAHGRADTPGD